MRLRSIALISVLFAAACGGGSGDHADATPRVDSRPTFDSPPSATCLMATTYDRDYSNPPDGQVDVLTLTFAAGDGLTGNMIDIDGDGTAETYAIGAIGVLNGLPGDEAIAANHGFQYLLIDTLGMFTAPQDFANAPLPNAVTLDGGNTCGGCFQGWGGWADGANVDLTTATQVYVDNGTGTMTITQFDPGLVAGQDSHIVGSVNNITMTGLNPADGTPLPDPGCTTAVTELDFDFTLTWTPPAVAPVHTTVKGFDWSKAAVAPITVGRKAR
jgi:hypothetical protein